MLQSSLRIPWADPNDLPFCAICFAASKVQNNLINRIIGAGLEKDQREEPPINEPTSRDPCYTGVENQVRSLMQDQTRTWNL